MIAGALAGCVALQLLAVLTLGVGSVRDVGAAAVIFWQLRMLERVRRQG